jgi:hypothetical protein
MPVTRRSEALVALLIGAVALTLATAAEANDALGGKELRSLQKREILSSLERPTSKRRWIPAHFHVEKKTGFEYRRSLTVGRRNLVWSVRGPVVAGEAYGLGFKLRF